MREGDSPPNCAGKVLPASNISIMVPAVATCIGGNVKLGNCPVPTAPSHPWVASHSQALAGSPSLVQLLTGDQRARQAWS